MRERALDEFESVFERASTPVLEIPQVKLARISTVIKEDALDESALGLASRLQKRFGSEVLLHWSAGVDRTRAQELAGKQQFEPAPKPFGSTEQLVHQVSDSNSQLVLLPEPEEEGARLLELDALVQSTSVPVLLLRVPLSQPITVFQKVLYGLTGQFQQMQNFAYSFTLVEPNGSLYLLHTIDESELEGVREALRVSPEITTGGREELLGELAQHGERYLKGVVAASRDQPYEVSYRVALGAALPIIQAELSKGDYGLLVIGAHLQGRSYVAADVYQLIHLVREVPVLAL